MMQQLAFSEHSDAFNTAISPLREMAAYEALWAEDTSPTFKTIADKFRAAPGALPSDLVSERLMLASEQRIKSLLADRLYDTRLCIHGTYDYPRRLRDARHPLEILYYQGIWGLTDTRCVAVAGSRRASPDGIKRAVKLVRHLVKDDFTVVSGLAEGIDETAHRAAIEAGGATIAVIGTPLSVCYPRKHTALQQQIASDHLVISQVPFIRYSMQDYRMNRLFFPERDITMAAIAEATIIVEASDTSGTLIQARAALAQGRKLFILDSCFKNPALSWPVKYAEKGAIRVKDYTDIHEVLCR